MFKSKENISEILHCIVLCLLIPIWIGLAPVWYKWYVNPKNAQGLKCLYDILSGNILVNIPVCLIIALGVFFWCKRIWFDKNFRFYRPVLVVIGFVVLFSGSKVRYARVIGCCDYRQVIAAFLGIIFFVMLLKSICRFIDLAKKTKVQKQEEKQRQESEESKEWPKGFSDDNVDEGSIPDSLKKYASEIVERLLVTNIKKQSYALGVTGEWGVGKTTFLRELREKVNGRAEIVEFNPWMCSSPEQVVNDFFASLRH